MCKSLVTIAAAVAILSAGSLVTNRVEAGASASAPMKISKADPGRGHVSGPRWPAYPAQHARDHGIFFLLGDQPSAEAVKP
jgi:hypothetical protein